MTFISSAFSAIGNNSALAPIVLKDNIENTGKGILAYQQGSKVSKEVGFYEARENVLEEFGTSAIWLAAPFVVKKAFDSLITNNVFGKDIAKLDIKLLKKGSVQEYKDLSKSAIKKFKTLHYAKETLAVGATLAMLFKLTDYKQEVTKDSIKTDGLPQGLSHEEKLSLNTLAPLKHKIESNPTFKAFIPKDNIDNNTVSFKGIGTALCIDSGIGAYRIGSARNKEESKEYMFKTGSFLAFCYGGGFAIEKAFDWAAKKAHLPISLDPVILASEKFAKGVKETVAKTAEAVDLNKDFFHFAEDKSEKGIIKFIDNEIENGMHEVSKVGNFGKVSKEWQFINDTLEFARKTKLIDVVDGARNQFKFVDTEAVHTINKNLVEFVQKASGNEKPAGKSVEKFIKSMKLTKYGAIGANVAICSAFTAYILPKVQYMFREDSIGTVNAPGLNSYTDDKPKGFMSALSLFG